MPSKTEEYLALAQRTANGLTRYWESWTDYLTTASRLYKYPFADQLMIYAQRPDATACADYDIWNNRMNRYVRRGSKGIALLDESSGFPRLHYVFDVSDTGVRRNSRDPDLWQYNDDLKQPVSEMLAATYGISGERVSQQLADVAGKLVADYWDNNSEDISAIVDGSLLMDYDEAGVEMQFKSAAAISVTYTLLERCGFEPDGYFDKDSFQAIYDFSTPDAVFALGAAVSDMSREVLRNIERTVKTTIRRRNAERSQYEYEQQERDLLDHRGLPAPEPDSEPAPEAAGQVRQAAPDVPDEPSPGTVQHDAPEWEPVPVPDGGGADGREPDAADHGAASETEPGPGQGAESDGMGAAHEQPESADRGTGADGADLQLSFFDAAIPTEAQQIEKIDQVESKKTPSAFVLSQAEIENELRKHGSGFMGGKQRIMALYQTQPDRSLRAKTLAKEYGIGGHSHDYLDGSRGFVNHDGRGMEFDHYPEHKKFALSWTQVEKYIDLMIQSDRYLTDKEKEHYTPPVPVSVKPDGALTHAKNLIRDFCLEEYDSEPDFSNLSKIGIAYTNATDEEIPIQINVDLVGYRVERYLGDILVDERQYESLEDLTETELEALDFSELVSVTDEELEHYHSKAEERSALLPLDAATEYNCADCGRRLTLQTHYSKKDGSTQYSYRCGGYASRVNGCTAHSISADNVEALILTSVKRFSRFVLKDEETFALELQSLWKEKREEKPKQNQSELKRCQKRYDELSALIRSLYENLMAGLLPERQYKQLMAQYDSEQAELESKMETMKSEIAEDKSSSVDIQHFISLIRKCKNPTEISDSMFNELVDKIVVYEAEGAGNARTQKVDIYFNYVGQVDIAYTEEELAELKAQKEQEERQRMEKQRKREKAYREKRKAKKIAENGGEIIKTKTCPHCGKVFTPTSNRQLFCSRECWNQARLEQKKADREAERGTHYYRQRTCAVCGHSYWPTHSQQEFCSDECRRINHNKKTLEFYHKKKGNLKQDPEATPTPKPKEDNAA